MKILTNPLTISGNILEIIKGAKEFLYLVSPFIKLKDFESIDLALIKRALMVAIDKKIDIRFITRSSKKSDSNPSVKLKPFLDQGCKLHIIDNLHSKVYCNESKALITSMNMYLHSIMNNEEIGVLISIDKEEKRYNQVKNYIHGLLGKRSHQKEEIILNQESEIPEDKDLLGYCIRCDKRIPVNKEKPLCWNCFNELKEFQGDIWGHICHSCGKFSNVTDIKPLCFSCYQNKS